MSFRSLAFSFRVGKTTMSSIVFETCQAIWDELVHEFMPTPTTEQFKQIANLYYRRWRFPNCIGSIDGKHCQIKNPSQAGSTYYNYLRYFSIVLQGVADADKKFITIDVGSRGKLHDASTFRSSKLFQLLEGNKLNVPLEAPLPNSNIIVPHVFIGDEAYPLKSYLMRPYPGRLLTPAQDCFNRRLSEARKCIECAFGILRAKWRFLSKEIETTPTKARVLIKCACLLHNIIRIRDGDHDLDYLHVLQETESPSENRPEGAQTAHRGNNAATIYAKNIRDHFTNYFETEL